MPIADLNAGKRIVAVPQGVLKYLRLRYVCCRRAINGGSLRVLT